jgi:hypothetical protein
LETASTVVGLGAAAGAMVAAVSGGQFEIALFVMGVAAREPFIASVVVWTADIKRLGL